MDKAGLINTIYDFVAEYSLNHPVKTRWGSPLIGFASAGDPLFSQLKQAVSPNHALPKDLLGEARTAAAYFLPFHESIAKSNREGRLASVEWARAYVETNELLSSIGAYLKLSLEEQGYGVAVPPPTHNFDRKLLKSDWSHRHIAYICGLGRFGLNNMLITENGCCGRFGSLVTSLELEPDKRSEAEACLFRFDGTCRRCVNRCVGEALFIDNFIRHSCYEVCLENERYHAPAYKADVCGKCIVGVPCSFTNPVKQKQRNP